MRNFAKLISFAAIAFSLVLPQAFAHAFLDHAAPGVGSTVSGSPGELTLSFTQGIAVAFAHVEIASAEGGKIAAGKPVADPSDPAVLHVKLEKPLKPGAYKVTWQVVSVDTHRTQGTFKFTVAP